MSIRKAMNTISVEQFEELPEKMKNDEYFYRQNVLRIMEDTPFDELKELFTFSKISHPKDRDLLFFETSIIIGWEDVTDDFPPCGIRVLVKTFDDDILIAKRQSPNYWTKDTGLTIPVQIKKFRRIPK